MATILAEHRKFTDALRGSADEAALAAAMTSLARAQIAGMPEAQRAMIPDVDAAIASVIKPQLAAMRSPWMRYFIDFDPATALAKVTCPVLAVYGDKDLQVPPSVNRAPLEAALARAGNRTVTVKVYPTANHLFREAATGHPSEYATLPKAFVTPLVADVSAWILAQAR